MFVCVSVCVYITARVSVCLCVCLYLLQVEPAIVLSHHHGSVLNTH